MQLTYRSLVDDTEVDVRFDAIEGGTRLHVTQKSLPGGEQAFLLAERPALAGPLVRRAGRRRVRHQGRRSSEHRALLRRSGTRASSRARAEERLERAA